ncbi:MAG: hypothetical protein ACTSQY_00310 [Candidatus Odinarchaeia archaeon]|nr:MAG: hypothetical protein [Lokiarchaeota virus Fenrir Meg22_1012]URC17241.1 MAG: hypothetical protein [Lokiarchaeota virus Fenrir Meg22_1214]
MYYSGEVCLICEEELQGVGVDFRCECGSKNESYYIYIVFCPKCKAYSMEQHRIIERDGKTEMRIYRDILRVKREEEE